MSRVHPAIVLPFLFLLSLFGTRPAGGQVGTASLAGEVQDQQAAVVPGATVTITNAATAAERVTTTDRAGVYRFVALAPGTYRLKVQLAGFNTAERGRVEVAVDTAGWLDAIVLTIESVTETVEVQATAVRNTTDATLGQVIGSRQIAALPLEARNVVNLMSLQPGAVFLPTGDPRSGAINGARSDQSNVTLDGVDVNDPEKGTAYTTVLRMPLDAIAEFRVTTSNYGAEQGRSSGSQISLVTKTGSNVFHGAAYGMLRNTATSSNEYFLKLSQLQAGQESRPPKLDKRIGGGALGGPVKENRLFFYATYEHLRESSELPSMRHVPSLSLRDGVVQYFCADTAACPGGVVRGASGASYAIAPGSYGLSPAHLEMMDPLGIGASRAMLDYWRLYPSPNAPGADENYQAFRFAAPIENRFNTAVARMDYTAARDHRLFARVNLMRDTMQAAPWFPGQQPASMERVRNAGFALGYDWVIGPSRVNTLRYGLTLIRDDTLGQLQSDFLSFGMYPIDSWNPNTPSYARSVATHNVTEDFSWISGKHTLRFGANLRFTRNSRSNNATSYVYFGPMPFFVQNAGQQYVPGDTCAAPGCAALPAAAAFNTQAFLAALGVMSVNLTTHYYDHGGHLLPTGSTIRRRFATDEYEMYATDSWRIGRDVTLNAGLRWSVYSPPWETSGMQVAPTENLGDWFDQRAANAARGIPASAAPTLTYDLAGAANGRRGLYDWQYHDVAPRLSVAWTPDAKGGWLKRVTGDRQLVLRGGYSLVYDRVGTALLAAFDGIAAESQDYTGAYPLEKQSYTPPFSVSLDGAGTRFTTPTARPALLPAAAPTVSFPYTPAMDGPLGTVGIDGALRTPYAHVVNAVLSRELPGGFALEAAYAGRFGRRLLVRRDVAAPVNLVNTKSGTDYFTAAAALARGIQASAGGDFSGVGPIAYWENLFPGAAGDGLTATQAIAGFFAGYGANYVLALHDLDRSCSPACSIFGPNAYFSPQFDSLGVQSSIGRADYNALQVTLRKRWSHGYQFDLNYTLSKSEDLASAVERGNSWWPQGLGGSSGVLVNPWQPERYWAFSDFDVRHQLNANWVLDVPYGNGRQWGRSAPKLLNAVAGGWSVAGLLRWTSGFPFNVANCCSEGAAADGMDGASNAELVTPGVLPATATTKNAIGGYPSAFADSQAAAGYFRDDLAGEVGIRNQLRGDGYFNVDLSVSKAWTVPNGTLRFRWDTFNVTNAVRFDVATITAYPADPSTFGRYNSTLATCDGRAGRCMQFALHYEF